MFALDLTLPSPAENLAMDEALLDGAEAGNIDETLRFWEPREHFVVVGYANRVSTEVNKEFCAANRIPINRRCTGGGTVLQGPGVLNYSVILRADATSQCATIQTANTFVMERNRSAVLAALQKTSASCAHIKPDVKVEGHTDLAFNGRKFSGNAQRRRRKYLLFHGSFLLTADLAKIEAALRMPSKQPNYRAGRTHGDFLTNLSVPVAELKMALKSGWSADMPFKPSSSHFPPKALVQRYENDQWNLKFP
jgi:lipoate---protein ligase